MKNNFLIAIIMLVFIFSCCENNKEVSHNNETLKNDSIEQIDISKLDADHPLRSDCFHRQYDNTNLEEMTKVSKSLHDSIESIIYSFKIIIEKDTCMSSEYKQNLTNTIDSLVFNYFKYVDFVRKCEELSFAEGKMSGLNSIDFEIYSTKNMLEYLKYITNLLYYTEPGVYPCDK